jgi:hypothetical protein
MLHQQQQQSTWGVVNTSIASTHAAVPQKFQSTLSSLFASLGALQGTKLTLNMPIGDFTKQVLQIPKKQSGNVMSLSRWRDTGAVTHEFLVLQATSPDGLPMYIRLDRRPVKGGRSPILLLSSATAASDSVRVAGTPPPIRTEADFLSHARCVYRPYSLRRKARLCQQTSRSSTQSCRSACSLLCTNSASCCSFSRRTRPSTIYAG